MFGERIWPNPGLAGLVKGKGRILVLQVRSLEKEPGINPDSEFWFRVRRKEQAETLVR